MIRAIIVEPDEGIRRLQRMILTQYAGTNEIVERQQIADAIPVFSTEEFGFAMVDISRPTDELREFLRISRKKQKSPVIAFTTGKITRETLNLLVTDHVFAVFPKPFEVEQVVTAVRAAIEAASTGTLYPKFFGFLDTGSKEE
jgi:DNA-binding NtrC family response regulator